MGYKQSPNPSIEAAGGLQQHIDSFFAERGLPYRYTDFIRYRRQGLTKSAIHLALETSRGTISKWCHIADKEQQDA